MQGGPQVLEDRTNTLGSCKNLCLNHAFIYVYAIKYVQLTKKLLPTPQSIDPRVFAQMIHVIIFLTVLLQVLY